MRTHMVSTRGGQRLALHHRPADGPPTGPPILYILGATYPTQPMFVRRFQSGPSWMEYCAQRGGDVFALDFRGFGDSDRPSEMAGPLDSAPPLFPLDDAVSDVDDAVSFILGRCNA